MPRNSQRQAIIDRLIESIRAERVRKGLSLNEVATRAGLDHTMVMRVEKRERMPTIDTLLRIAEAIEINLGTFLVRAIKATTSSSKT